VLNGGKCERKRQLLEDVLRVLSQVHDISGHEAETLHQSATGDPAKLESALNRAIREQEKALAALKRHQQEHGC